MMVNSFVPPPPPAAPVSVAPPAPQPSSQPQAAQPSTQPTQHQQPDTHEIASSGSVMLTDYTKYPVMLDEHYEKLDRSNAVRPTIIKVGPTWSKSTQKALLAAAVQKSLDGSEQDKERKAAFDLLDALSRSGGLVLENVSLHVVIAATHSFDDTLMTCLVQKNMNPIEHVERSMLIMGSVLHGVSAKELVREHHVGRLMELETESNRGESCCKLIE
jgi:hypothetical protein